MHSHPNQVETGGGAIFRLQELALRKSRTRNYALFPRKKRLSASYAINQVQDLVIYVPTRIFVFSTLANISNSNEEANTFFLVAIHFLQIFSLLHPTV